MVQRVIESGRFFSCAERYPRNQTVGPPFNIVSQITGRAHTFKTSTTGRGMALCLGDMRSRDGFFLRNNTEITAGALDAHPTICRPAWPAHATTGADCVSRADALNRGAPGGLAMRNALSANFTFGYACHEDAVQSQRN
jgi:hypothetical protein